MDTTVDRAAIWEQYSRTRDQRSKERLILSYVPLVHRTVARVVRRLPAAVDMQDAVNTGTIGLIQAIDRFEPGRGIKFETFASTRIRGAVVDELRRIDWVPRSVRRRLKTIEEARSALGQTLGRSASQLELSESLDAAHAQLVRTTGPDSTFVLSLEQLMNVGNDDEDLQAPGDRLEDHALPSPEDIVVRRGLHDALAAALDQLNERDRMVIALHYRGELTHSEIGRRLGLSESRICQLHSRAIWRLRIHLAKWAPPRSETRPAGEPRRITAGRTPAVVADSSVVLPLSWRSALRASA